jgi:DNA-binding CsgD family transcriptional regulator
MNVGLVVSTISAIVALASAGITALLSARAARERLVFQAEIERQEAAHRKQEERQDLMNRIRDPLLWAAFDLQSRIYNIVAQHFLYAYLLHGSEDERAYAKRNTVFVFAQYLGWQEIVRRSVQFLDLGSRQDNLKLVNYFSKAAGILSSDSFPGLSSNSFPDSSFRVFRGDQRAIGEIMISMQPSGELACIGYAEFCAKVDADAPFVQWFTHLVTSTEQLASAEDPSHPRLVALQHNLVDLINLLDPDASRFPDRLRKRLSKSPLSQSEKQMLAGLASYSSVTEIAEQLDIEPAKADFLQWTLMQKLSAQTPSEAVEIAKQNGWL